MMLLTMVGTAQAQTSQYVTGSFTLGSYSTYIDDDRNIWFDDTQNVNSNSAVRDAFFEANGIFDCTIGGGECDLTTTLQAEVLAASVSTAKESQLRTEILAQMTDDFDCLQTYYTGSTVVVGSDTYFNTIKPCYVRLIKDHGILEEIFHDEPDAWFLVHKIQAIQTDLQHLLAMEDQSASLSFSVGVPTAPIDALTLTIEPGPSANTYVINLNSADAFSGVTNVQFAFVSDVANDYTGGTTTVTGDGFLTGSVEQVNTNDAAIAQGTIQFLPSSSNTLTATITSPLVGTGNDEFLLVNAFNVYENGGIIGGSNDNIAYFLQGDLSQTYITINDEIFGQGMSSSANPGIGNILFPTTSTTTIQFGNEAALSSSNILFPFVVVPNGETISFTSPAGTSTIGTVTNTVSNVDIILIGAQGSYQVNDDITITADNVLADGDMGVIAVFAGTKDASDSNNFVIATQADSGVGTGGSITLATDHYISDADTSLAGVATVEFDSMNTPGAPLDGTTGFGYLFFDPAQPLPIITPAGGITIGSTTFNVVDPLPGVQVYGFNFNIPSGAVTPGFTLTTTNGPGINAYLMVVLPEGQTANGVMDGTTLADRTALGLLNGAGDFSKIITTFFDNYNNVGTNYFMPNDATFGPPNRVAFTPQVSPARLYGMLVALYPAGPDPTFVPAPNPSTTITPYSAGVSLGPGAELIPAQLDWYLIDGGVADELSIDLGNTFVLAVEGATTINTAVHESGVAYNVDSGAEGFTPTGGSVFDTTNVETEGYLTLILAGIIVIALFLLVIRRNKSQ